MLQSFAFPRSSPEALGLSSAGVAGFLDALASSKIEVHTFMIVRHGQVAAEGAWAPYRLEAPHILFSLSKSFSSTAIGFAVQENRLTVDDPVVSFFPEYATEAVVRGMDGLKVRHLLAMATGHDVETGSIQRREPGGDWVKAFLETPIALEPGKHFLYNSGASYMLSAIIRRVTGEVMADYLKPRLFDPLGIGSVLWETCPKGDSEGASGLHLTTDAVARFGQLYLNKGVWNGRRLLSEAWIEEATSMHTPNNPRGESRSDWNSGYGYQIWRCRHDGAYRADGAFGQYCIVIPDRDAVIALTSGTDRMSGLSEIIWEHLLPALTPEPDASAGEAGQPLAAAADRRSGGGDGGALRRKIAGLAYLPPRVQPSSPEAERLSGKRYGLEPNQKEARAVSFTFGSDACVFRLWDDRGEHAVRCGYGEWILGETLAAEDEWVKPVELPWKVAASGTWQDSRTFVMTWRFIETTFTCTVTCRFRDERLTLRFERNLTFDTYDFPPIEGAVISS